MSGIFEGPAKLILLEKGLLLFGCIWNWSPPRADERGDLNWSCLRLLIGRFNLILTRACARARARAQSFRQKVQLGLKYMLVLSVWVGPSRLRCGPKVFSLFRNLQSRDESGSSSKQNHGGSGSESKSNSMVLNTNSIPTRNRLDGFGSKNNYIKGSEIDFDDSFDYRFES